MSRTENKVIVDISLGFFLFIAAGKFLLKKWSFSLTYPVFTMSKLNWIKNEWKVINNKLLICSKDTISNLIYNAVPHFPYSFHEIEPTYLYLYYF
jgi:hypothetical protein